MRRSVSLRKFIGRVGTRSPGPTGSSISDSLDYRTFCERAAGDDAVFATFRRAPIYVQILEHVGRDQGAAYIEAIERDSPDLLKPKPGWYGTNDQAGSPQLYEYELTGPVSPVTLRYLKVVSDLRVLFGDLSNLNVVEIGVGYGSQCRLITQQWPVASYTLIDIEPALALTRRYLSALGTDAPVRYESPSEVQARDYDLCISNYAFSELRRPVQQDYAESVVSRSARGYMTCNFISHIFKVESMGRSELGSLHAGTHWMAEEPLTYRGNAILVWGDSQAGSVPHEDPSGPVVPR